MLRVRWLAVVLFTMCLSSAEAQRIALVSYSSRDGLAQSVVMSLAQSPDGMLWIGTSAGLSRFDGVDFVTLDEDDGLSSDVVRCLLGHSDGSVWVGGEEGVVRLRDGHLDRPVPSLDGSAVRSLIEDSRGGVWIASYEGGLVRWSPEGAEHWGADDGITELRLRSLALAENDAVWVGSYGGGVYRLENGELSAFGAQSGLDDLFVRAMLVTSTGEVLAGTGAGISRFDGEGFTPYAPAAFLDGQRVVTLAEDREGQLWAGTRALGLCRLTGSSPRCYGPEQGLGEASVMDLLVDLEGNLWIASYGGGLQRLVDEEIGIVTDEIGLPGNFVEAFAELDDQVYIGIHNQGMIPFSGELKRSQLIAADEAVLSAYAEDQTLWIGTLRGALRSRGSQLEAFGPATPVYDIDRDADGTLWLGTIQGLYGISGDQQRHYTTQDGLPHDRINTILVDDDGLWVGGQQGAARIEGGEVVMTLEKGDGLADPWIEALAKGPDGAVWIASARGLDRWHDGRLENFNAGLSNQKCTSLVFDRLGRLWVGTSGGIDVIDGEGVYSYGPGMGLPSIEVAPDAAFLDHQGKVWMGTVGGALIFSEGISPHTPQAPLLAVKQIQVNDSTVAPDSLGELAHGQNRLRFELRALAMSYPNQVEFRHQLIGLESSTRLGGPEIEYSALPSGSFLFEAQARQAGGPWSELLSLPIEIAVPLWATWWFRSLAVALLGMLGLAAHRLRSRSIRHRNEILEGLVASRTRELEAERLEVGLRNDQLRLVSRIVQRINEEPDLEGLLRVILDQARSQGLAVCGLALVLNQQDGIFESRSALGIETSNIELDSTVLAELIFHATSIDDGIHLVDSRGLLPEDWPPKTLMMILEIDDAPDAVLLFGGHWSSLDDLDLETFRQLEVHLESAVLKGRILEQLAAANQAKNDFLGLAAHDLRNPLGGVKGYTDLLLRLLDEDRRDPVLWRRFLENIRISAEQMHRLVDDLLDVAAIEGGQIQLKLETFSIDPVVEQPIELLRQSAEAKNLGIELEPAEPGIEIFADRIRLSEIIDNLVSNAIKYSEPGGTIRIGWKPTPSHLEVWVADQGQGFTKEDLEKVFSGGQLSAKPTGGESSTGIGLVIVKKLVEAHGGRIHLESVHGEGATVRFTLPAEASDS